LFLKETDARLKLICVTYLGTCLYFFSLSVFSMSVKNPVRFKRDCKGRNFF